MTKTMTKIHRNTLTTAMTRAAAVLSIALAVLWPGWREELRSQTYYNRVSDNFGVVGGGNNNQAGDNAGTTSDKPFATVGGGFGNAASGQYATVGGGYGNAASSDSATVGGGRSNIANGVPSATVGGGEGNTASGQYATVGGGRINTANVSAATVSGGNLNRVTDDSGSVGGGVNNQAGDNAGTTSDKPYATVGGGQANIASGPVATVGGGLSNTTSNDSTTVGGGRNNIASGAAATVPGGLSNSAVGNYSFAAGVRARANHPGAFVWADSTDADFASTGSNQFLIRAAGGVGIGTASPTVPLEVTGTVKATAFSGDGSALTNVSTSIADGSVTSAKIADGTIVNADINSSAAISPSKIAGTAATLGANSFFGTQTISSGNLALPATTSSSNGVITLGGTRFLHNYGVGNTFVGTNAGNFTMTGNGGNTALGAQALGSNTSGYNNTANGFNALYSNTSGYNNTASGLYALYFNTTGVNNTASGLYALYSNSVGFQNIASGAFALYSNTAGYNNTASGLQALFNNTTGYSNTASGLIALFNNTTGFYNTALGYGAGATATTANANTTGSSNTFIGYNSGPGVPSASNLQNATAIGANAVVSASNALVLGSINGVNGATSDVNVGIGTASPSEKLHVMGNILASGTITPSSRRLKTNIRTLQGALEKVEGLRGVSFNWKETGKHDIGLIAEEVGEVVPEVVAYEANGVDAKGIDYARLVSVLIEAVKEQQIQIRQLQSEVDGLKARMGVEVSKAVMSDK